MSPPKRGSRVALYIRVSTDKQVDAGHSLDGQRAKLEQHAQAKDFEVVRVVVDGGESAGTLDRPGIAELRKLIAEGAIDGVVVTKADRLSRNLRDLLNFASELADQKVSITTVDGTFDTSSAFGKAMANMQGVFAELERDLVRERTREGMAAAKAKGVRLGRPPLGYVADPSVKGGLVATATAGDYDTRRQSIRDFISALRSTGDDKPLSWRKVAEQLNADAVPTITGKVGTWDHKRAKAASIDGHRVT